MEITLGSPEEDLGNFFGQASEMVDGPPTLATFLSKQRRQMPLTTAATTTNATSIVTLLLDAEKVGPSLSWSNRLHCPR
ncbi:MAG: hypothetical protein Q9177_001184 [Variospora cf. flavescens]